MHLPVRVHLERPADRPDLRRLQNLPIIAKLVEVSGSRGQSWHLLTAAAFVSMVLPLIVFFSLQRYFVRGLLAGSVKG